MVNLCGVLAPSIGTGNRGTTESARVERRKRPRAGVHWPILLFRGQNDEDGDAVETITQNLSSHGFYCLSATRFTVGEWLRCRLQILPGDPGAGASRLECRVQVVRVEENVMEGLWGIACRTEDYRFVTAQVDGSFPGGWLSTSAPGNPAKS